MSDGNQGEGSHNLPPPGNDGLFNGAALEVLRKLEAFDIRNGPVDTARSLLIRATIPTCYKWIQVENMPPNRAKDFDSAYIFEQHWYLKTNKPANLTDEQIRKAAIALGMARAVASTYYILNPGDFVPGEVVPSQMRFRAGRAAAPGVEAIEEGLEFLPTTPAAVRNEISTGFVFSEIEKEVVANLVITTIGIIPVQGFSILNCGHHYIGTPGHQSYKAFYAIEKQQWGLSPVENWYTSDEAMLRDVLWHNSCHSINMDIKVRAAADVRVKTMLLTTRAGVAAARLPANEFGAKAVEAYTTLFNVLRPMFDGFEGEIDSTIFDIALDTLDHFPPGTNVVPQNWNRPPEVPAAVVDRMTCMHWVGQVCARNAALAAQCYGLYCAMLDAGVSLGNAASQDSLCNAYSLKKLSKFID